MEPTFIQRSLGGLSNKVMALDPGETTGICLLHGADLKMAGQLKDITLHKCFKLVRLNIELSKPEIVVMEDYKVYDWKAVDHSWSSLFTPRLIGAIECYLEDVGIPLVKQMAQQAKGFCTDDKLVSWGLWRTGQRHARDAIRHAYYYQLFEVAQVHKQRAAH